MMGKKDRQPTEDELRLWREAVSDGNPKTDPVTGGPPPVSVTMPKSEPRKPKQKPRTLAPGGVGKHEARAIKRGSLPIEGRIDLHGMTQVAAQSDLTEFIQDSARRGLRCVLVITGKGAPKKDTDEDTDEDLFMPRRPGVLRDATPRWLSGPELARHVIGYQPALPRDGGAGALYVLLRRG